MTQKAKRSIMLIDMQSFYASCEKALHPEYKDKPLVVAGDPERRSGIILAACPLAKKKGVTTAEAIWQALQKCPELTIVRPHMQHYIDVSMQITRILESYSDLVEPYSIDELFVDCSGSLHLFGNSIHEMALLIQKRIMAETGIYARAGMGENKVVAKLCCDMIAKKNENGIFYLKKDELDQHIWNNPIRDMWGIGSRMEKHLIKMGIRTIGDLAKTPPKRLAKWGVNGQVIWRVANGIDDSPVTPSTHSHQKVIGNGMTLPRDYREAWEIEVVLLDLTTEVTRRARKMGVQASVISVGCSGADWDNPTGFSRQKKMIDPTNSTLEVFKEVKKVFHTHWDGLPVRRLNVSLSSLSDADSYQLNLFSENNEREKTIDKVMDEIEDRFGSLAIMRASSITTAGQAIDRAAKIGGHYK